MIMRILFLANQFPFPKERNGSTLINYYLLKNLLAFSEIDFVSFLYKNEEIVKMEFANTLNIITINKANNTSGIRKILDTFLLRPYECKQYYDKRYQAVVNKLLSEKKYDIIYTDLLFFSQYVEKINDQKIIISPHDSLALLSFRLFKNENRIFKKTYYALRYLILKKYQDRIISGKNYIFFVSDIDLKFKQTTTRTAKCFVIPIGVDIHYFYPKNCSNKNIDLCFVGNFSYIPNIEAAMFFIKKVYPIIKKIKPDVNIYFIGGNVGRHLLELSNEHIIFTGFVSDIREYIWKSKIFVSPLLSGAGMKIKILEAMAMKIPIVATTISCEGIDNTCDVFKIKDKERDIANTIIDYLENPITGIAYANRAYENIKNNYSWEAIDAMYKKIIDEIILE